MASAFSLCRCIRMPRVLMPRDVRNASNGLDTAPAANWVNSTCSATSSCPAANTRPPPTMSEWPPRYFVVECTTTSAPSATRLLQRGRGEGVVDDHEHARLVAELGERRDVRDLHQRVRRRLDPEHLGGAELDRRRAPRRGRWCRRWCDGRPRRRRCGGRGGGCRRTRRCRSRRGRRAPAPCGAGRPPRRGPTRSERPRMPPSSAASWVSSAVRVGLPPREYS